MRPALFLIAFLAFAAEEVNEWTPAHSMKIRGIAQVSPSPDGRKVLWTETLPVMTEEKSETLTHIWLANADGSDRVQLTRGPKSATDPRFSPDGRFVFFASERSGKKDLYRIPVATSGEAEMLTDWKAPLGRFAVSPDGKHIAFTGAEEDKELEKRKKSKTDFRIIDDKPRNHALWVMALEGGMPGKPRKLVDKPEYHVGAFDWSPDSRLIAFERRPRPDADVARAADISEVEVSSAAIKDIAATDRSESDPIYSPDGRRLAYVRAQGARSRLDGNRIALVDLRSGQSRDLPATVDEAPALLDWMPDSRSLLYVEMRGTRAALYRMPVDGPAALVFTRDRGTFAPGRLNLKGTHVGLVIQSPEEPAEAFVAPVESARLGKAVQLSRSNTDVPMPPLGRTEVIRWKSKDGREIEGLLTYPAGYKKGGRVPLILNIHGGPSGVFTETFTGAPGLYPIAAFAAKGFAVLRPNPRGSSGYSAAVRRMVVQDWGGLDFQDLISGVDHVIGMGVGDPDRLAVMGWSYGGYMTAWTVTQTTRFRAAAVGAGITNNVSMYGTQDIPSVFEDYFGGTPWDEKQVYARSSPIEFVSRVKTPTMILHGEADPRVPVTQGYEFYRALKRQGVPVEMVVYPRMPHGPNEPKFQLDIMERHLAWAEKYLK